ncbi:MAG: SDR family oxidoreductase [Nitrososphaerales archaeon]
MTNKVALVTGSSSGIGYATSLMLARNGFHTYASMRQPDKSQGIIDLATSEGLPLQVIHLDVNDNESVKGAITKIIAERGRIDILVNNAGYGLAGCVEDLSMEELRAQFDTNLFGIILVTQAVLPTMKKQGEGMIVNMSSIVGLVAFPGAPAYVSTKFALEGLSDAMRFELEPFGIRVVIIEPGLIGTNFRKAMVIAKKAQDPNSPYAQFLQKITEGFTARSENATPADEVAKVILKAVTTENPEFRYLVGEDAIKWMEARKKMSDREFERFVKKGILEHAVQ